MRSIQSSDHQFVSVNDLNIQSQQFADSLPKFERHLKTPQQHQINNNEERMAGRPNEEAKVNPDQVKVGKFGSGTPSKSGAHLNSSTKARQTSPKKGFGNRNPAHAKPSQTQR